jgi:hypothetical protein
LLVEYFDGQRSNLGTGEQRENLRAKPSVRGAYLVREKTLRRQSVLEDLNFELVREFAPTSEEEVGSHLACRLKSVCRFRRDEG